MTGVQTCALPISRGHPYNQAVIGVIYHVVRDGRAPWMLAAYIKIRADTVRGCLRACHSNAYALPDSASGSATSTVVPRPSALSMDRRPPCAAAVRHAIANPSPARSGFEE